MYAHIYERKNETILTWILLWFSFSWDRLLRPWQSLHKQYFSLTPPSLTCQFHAQASCYVDLPATSAEPQRFPPFDAPSSPEEASSAVGSRESLICDVNFGDVDVLTIHFLNQKQVNRVFHLVNSCIFSHPDVNRTIK